MSPLFQPRLLTASIDKLPRLPPVVVPDEKPLLPAITPNYKPLPRVPVREEAPESCLTKMTEEEALNFVFQSKSNRCVATVSYCVLCLCSWTKAADSCCVLMYYSVCVTVLKLWVPVVS